MKSRSVVSYRTVVAVLMAGFIAAPAYAGFEWTPPPAEVSAPEPGPEIFPSPADKVEIMELTPVPVMEEVKEPVVTEASVAPVEPLPPPVISKPVEAPQPVVEIEEEVIPEPAPVRQSLNAPALQGRFAETVGFGSDIPLALALGQIVPPEFAYSFAAGVNPGLKISWNGGKPWNEVLNESLRPKGLRADVTGNAVIVRGLSSPERRSEISVPPEMPETHVKQANLRGEGTAESYPRRHPAKKNFLSSIFSSDPEEQKGAPPPPDMDRQVIVENTAPVIERSMSDRDIDKVTADRVRNYEPAAPGATLAELAAVADREAERELALKNSPLATQKVSYAQSRETDKDSIFPERTVSRRDDNTSGAKSSFDPAKVGFWQADNKQDLRDVLAGWSETAGVEMIWDSGYNYKLPTSFSMQGTFSEAVTKILSLYGSTEPRPTGRVHPNLPKGPSILLVENHP